MKHWMKFCAMVALSGCAEIVPIAGPLFPQERLTPRGSDQQPLMPQNGLDLSLEGFPSAQPEPFSLLNVPICDAAAYVLGSQLSVPYVCEADGLVSLSSTHTNPDKLIALFAQMVRVSGGSFIQTPAGFAVSGQVERGATLSGDTAPPDADASTSSVGFTVLDIASGDSEVLHTLNTQSIQRDVVFLPSSTSLGEFRALASSLGLDVELQTYRSYTVASGTAYDVGVLQAIGFNGYDLFLAIPYAVGSEDTVEGLSGLFPDLAFALSPTEALLRVTGPHDLVAQFHRSFRSSIPLDLNVRLAVTVFSIESAAFDEIDLDFGAFMTSSGLTLTAGSADARSLFSARIEHLLGSSRAVKEASPTMVVRSGRVGNFSSGRSVPVLRSVGEEGERNIEYVDTGSLFSVSALVRSDRTAALEISVQEITALAGADALTPEFIESSLSTSVVLAVGDVLVIGGLDSNSKSQYSSRGIFSPSRSDNSSTSKTLIMFEYVAAF
jgi:hypothetical protein